ncbi:glycosyltransferase [Polynucleobacter paneuropaeus]|uniref:glycosyltransferase n=1 Tax=Polynucleobacter paneuropaeus TaxID=2527775 RepID=UPI001BFD0AF4|nr:glycosyltransferase [Polynucleobacter paneuropaeus]QWD49700.1 glycosyltransferase [Polynucleobacter paneuropaeus]
MITFIVPVYNVEKYLAKCVHSLISQSCNDFEILLINDGSTDGSLEICEELASQHVCIKVFTQLNSGQGQARNLGLQNASGEFIAYVDADDWVEPTLVADALTLMNKTDADFMSFGIRFVEESGKVRKTINSFNKNFLLGREIFFDAMLERNILTVCWNKIYKKSFLVENQILFPDIKVNEDIVYSRLCSFFAKKAVFTNKIYYSALVRSGSTSRTMNKAMFEHSIRVINLEKELFGPFLQEAGYSYLLDAHIIKFCCYLLVQGSFRIKDSKEYYDCYQLLASVDFPGLINNKLALASLSSKTHLLVELCRRPKFLRMLASILKYTFISRNIY